MAWTSGTRASREKRRRAVSNPLADASTPHRRRSWAPIAGVALAATLSGEAPASEQGAGSPPPTSVALTVRVQGLSNDRGRVAVAVFASADAFPDQKRALTGQLAKIEKGRAAVRFAGLKPGIYAVAVLHDENENSKMDFNFLGMPLEGYGFSNDASAAFGPPSFQAASFALKPRDSFIPVRMRYFF
jgi:uncharacterized protein (DUF2141 family)